MRHQNINIRGFKSDIIKDTIRLIKIFITAYIFFNFFMPEGTKLACFCHQI